MIEKNTLPGCDEYFQHLVRALNVECEDLNIRQGGGGGAGGGGGGQNGQTGVGGGGGAAKKAKGSAGGGAEPKVQRGSAPPGVGGGRRPGSGRGECARAMVQGWAKEWSLGCVNSLPTARGSQEAGFTEPREHSFDQPCTSG